MKKAIIGLVLLVATTVMAQDKSTVTVKSSEVSSDVIVLKVQQVDPQQDETLLVLQCSKAQAGCAVPAPGNYLMVRLPKNWGMYDGDNVDLYPASGDMQTSHKIGEYCLIEK